MFILVYFIKLGKFLPIISSSILFSFWNSHNTHIGSLDGILPPLGPVHFFHSFSFFLLLRLDNFTCIIFKLIDFFPDCSKLLLNPFLVKYSFCYVFQLQNLYLVPFEIISTSLCYFHFVHTSFSFLHLAL